jgi:hypothetical protein
MPPLLSPPSLDFEYTLRSQMILLALFAALHYPVRGEHALTSGAL